MALSKSITGARCLFSLDNQIMAFANGVNINESVEYDAVEPLGILAVREWAPIAYRVDMSAGAYRTVGTGEGEGSLKQRTLFPKESAILVKDPMVALIADRGTRKIIGKVGGVFIQSHSLNISARGLVGVDINMVAIRMTDESELV